MPVFEYFVSEYGDSDYEDLWDILIEAEDNGYIMGAATEGAGDDQDTNDCGVAMSHAYSIISAFTMEDSDSDEHRMLLMRNPWGENYYSWDWK